MSAAFSLFQKAFLNDDFAFIASFGQPLIEHPELLLLPQPLFDVSLFFFEFGCRRFHALLEPNDIETFLTFDHIVG